MYLLKMFGISLGLTLLLELPVGYLLGLRGRKNLLLAVLVNVLTNPAAVLLSYVGVPQLPVELVVFAVEGWIYLDFSRTNGWNIPHPLRLAIVCNLVSWLTGMLIQMMGG